ncbi:MAG: HigA family addiction module antidote protein [Sphingomonadales bacterium]|jgi:addiction module HigA family antidote|nr:HigA family addiction module antidote protein [Sphingomonadales bacterium]
MDGIELREPCHIGEFVREIVEGHGLNVSSGARHLRVTRQALSTLMNCNGGLSSEMGLRLEKAFGVKMDTLMRMQTAWEIAEARKREDEVLVERFAA